MLLYFLLWILPGGWCHFLQVLLDSVFRGWLHPALKFCSALRIVCAKVEQPGSCLAMSPWPLCASSGTGAVTQCFDIYCPMRVPNSKFFMVRLNCYNFENFAISWSICLGQCSHHAQFCADLICPIINYHNTSTLLSYSFMSWGFLIWSF